MAKEDEKVRERQHENEAEKNVKEYLAVCPARVVAGLRPSLFRDRVCHHVKLATRGFQVGPEKSAS